MRSRIFFTIAAVLCFLPGAPGAKAQSDKPPKFEVAAEFTSITKPDFNGGTTEPGFGGRFTYNIRKNVAVEAAGYFFPHKCNTCIDDNAGHITEGLFGVKAGKRFQKWGIFAKGRPGFVSFSEGAFNIVPTGTGGSFPFRFEVNRRTNFAFDLGGVIEFYPSRRIVTRFDAGDTLIHYSRRTINYLSFDPVTGALTLSPFTRRAKTQHNFQFMASVGFRF